MATLDTKIATLEAKLKEAKAQQRRALQRQQAAQAKQKRAQDTRRKILAGSLLLDLMDKDEATKDKFQSMLRTYLTRDDDRSLFGFEARE